MSPFRFYIQQLHFDGENYLRGSLFETYADFGAACKEFKDNFMPEAKNLATRDWIGKDGLEVYVPDRLRLKEFNTEAEFIITGNPTMADDEATYDAMSRRNSFIRMLYGRNTGAVGARLAIYDEHSGLGYKDVVVSKVEPDVSGRQQGGNEAVYVLKVSFTIYDPVTDVSLGMRGTEVEQLIW